MNSATHFDAPWSTSLRLLSAFATVLLLSVTALLWLVPPVPIAAQILTGATTAAVLAGCALFTVRGYDVTPDGLYVQRLLWRTRIELTGLRSVAVEPGGVPRPLRLCGNGGLFAFSGWFRSSKLGRFRLCATDLARVVVLEFRDTKWMVSPERPEEFAVQVKRKAGLA